MICGGICSLLIRMQTKTVALFVDELEGKKTKPFSRTGIAEVGKTGK